MHNIDHSSSSSPSASGSASASASASAAGSSSAALDGRLGPAPNGLFLIYLANTEYKSRSLSLSSDNLTASRP